MMEPSRGLVFAGVHQGTVYVSADLGRSWEPKSKGITHNHVFSLNFVEKQGKVKLYAGTEPAHLFESDDLGETWNELPSLRSVPSVPAWNFPAPPHVAHVKNITFDSRNPDTIYVSIEQGGLLKSEDGGLSWEEFHGFYEDVHRLVIRPSNPKCFYITGGDGLYRSHDGGATWEHLTDRSMRAGYPDALLIHPYLEDLMFMAGASASPNHWPKSRSANSVIVRSHDAGRSWEVLHGGLPEHIRGSVEAMVMEACGKSFSLFAGTTDGDVFNSDDEGEHWTKLVGGLPPISKHGHYRLLQ